MAKSVSAGKLFQTSAICAMVAATGAMFALGAVSLFAPAAPKTAEKPVQQVHSPVVQGEPEIVVAVAPAIRKPVDVTLTGSTDKLRNLFRKIGYELDGVRERGEVPRVFIASLPADLKQLRRADLRKITFIKSTLPLILHANELIEQERQRILELRDRAVLGQKLTPEETAWLADTADRYGLDSLDFDALLMRVDIIPPSLAIAQAAEESGWGTSRFAREGNALFGQRAYKAHRKGIVPKGRPDGKTFRVRAFDHLIDGVKAYVHNLNSHFAYKDFRDLRESLRGATGHIDGYALAGSLLRYSERGEDYIETIRVIMRVNALQVFDAAKLGKSVSPDDDAPDA
ncbi:MAG: glucosaminidase domain-containing protein [Alphaproteobacteria bacterium]